MSFLASNGAKSFYNTVLVIEGERLLANGESAVRSTWKLKLSALKATISYLDLHF